MSTPLRATVEQLIGAFEARDLGAVLALLADDAVLIDPHYPSPRMRGKGAIAGGLRWSFSNLETLRFPIVTYFESADGCHAAVEVAAAHVARGGMRLTIPQVFIIDVRDGLVTRVQAYPPYGPGGIGGLLLRFARLRRRLLDMRGGRA